MTRKRKVTSLCFKNMTWVETYQVTLDAHAQLETLDVHAQLDTLATEQRFMFFVKKSWILCSSPPHAGVRARKEQNLIKSSWSFNESHEVLNHCSSHFKLVGWTQHELFLTQVTQQKRSRAPNDQHPLHFDSPPRSASSKICRQMCQTLSHRLVCFIVQHGVPKGASAIRRNLKFQVHN